MIGTNGGPSGDGIGWRDAASRASSSSLSRRPGGVQPRVQAGWHEAAQCRLKNWTARSCFSAAGRVLKVPRFLRRPVLGSFLRE